MLKNVRVGTEYLGSRWCLNRIFLSRILHRSLEISYALGLVMLLIYRNQHKCILFAGYILNCMELYEVGYRYARLSGGKIKGGSNEVASWTEMNGLIVCVYDRSVVFFFFFFSCFV